MAKLNFTQFQGWQFRNAAWFQTCIHCIFWAQVLNPHFLSLWDIKLLWYTEVTCFGVQFHSAKAHNPQVFFTPRPGSIPATEHKSWDAGQWAVPHASTELLPFSRGGLLITKSTEASTVWMTSVRLMSASKLTPPKAVLHCHKSFVSKAALLKNAPKHSLSCFYHCPHHQSTWGPSSLVLSKMTNMSHLIHSLFPSQESLGTVNCFHKALVSCISAAVPGRGGRVKCREERRTRFLWWPLVSVKNILEPQLGWSLVLERKSLRTLLEFNYQTYSPPKPCP